MNAIHYNIYIPKPITFDNHKSGCSYIMEKLNFINNYFIHLTLNDVFPLSNRDKLIGRIYTEPVSDKILQEDIFLV